MAGSGDLLPKMIKRVAKLGIADKFHFTGFLKGDDVDKMFGLSDVYVMPSVSEPFGISPLEAMRSNVPVIISKQSGVSEVLPNVLQGDFWDINGMAEKVLALINYRVLGEECLRQSKPDLEKLTWENAANKILAIYNEVR